MEEDINQRPPSNIRIRTLESDLEQMREAGGHPMAGRILGKTLEETTEKKSAVLPDDGPAVEKPLFESKEETAPVAPKKSKMLPIIIGLLVVFLLGGASAYFLLKPKTELPVGPAPEKTPQYSSLFVNPPTEKSYLEIGQDIASFEKLLAAEFKNNYNPDSVKELVWLKDEINILPADDFVRMIFSNFPGVNSADIPNFENSFSFLIANNQSQNESAYILKINGGSLPTFAIANLKSKFSAALEKMLEENPDILSSQYLENVGQSRKPFLSQDVGPIKARYLRFSAGPEFYYGWRDDYLLIATGRFAFDKLLEAFLPKI